MVLTSQLAAQQQAAGNKTVITPQQVTNNAVGINLANHTALPGVTPIGSNPNSAQTNANNQNTNAGNLIAARQSGTVSSGLSKTDPNYIAPGGEKIGNYNPSTGAVQQGPVSSSDLYPTDQNGNTVTSGTNVTQNNPSYDANGNISLSGLKAMGVNSLSDIAKYQTYESGGQMYANINGNHVRLPNDIVNQYNTQAATQKAADTKAAATTGATIAGQTSTGGGTTGTTGGTITPAPTTTPEQTGANAAVTAGLTALGPTGAALASAYAQQQQQSQNDIASNQTMNNTSMANTNNAYQGVQDSLDKTAQGWQDATKQMQDLVTSIKQQNDQDTAIQEKAAKDQLAWTEGQSLRADSLAKAQAHDSIVAQLALSGGFGQDAGLAEVRQSDAVFESKMDGIRQQFGVDSTNLSAKFSSIYAANKNTYAASTMANIKDLQTHLETLATQGNTNTVAWQTAKDKLLSDAWTTQTGLRKDLATSNLDAAKEMQTMTDANAKAAEQKRQFDVTNTTKNAAIDAANNNRETQQGIAAGVHDDAMTQTDSAGVVNDLKTIHSELAQSTGAYAVYQNVTAFKHGFDNAYNTFNGNDPNTGLPIIDPKTGKQVVPTAGQRAAADSQMSIQFSHSQNPGSLRIQDIAAAMAGDNQSLFDKITATIQKSADGGSPLTDDIRKTMYSLVAQHYTDAQSAATNQVLTEWGNAQSTNANYPKARQPITPSNLTNDPVILNAIYKTENSGLHDFLHGGTGGQVTAPSSLQSFHSAINGLGTVTQDFTTPVDYTKSGEHGAIDVAMKQGANIPAFSGGKVVLVQDGGDLGNHVEVKDANGYTHIYAHLSGTDLKVGDTVTPGTEIGVAGHTGHTNRDIEKGGSHTGDHLHYQINGPDGKPVDPYAYYGDTQIASAGNNASGNSPDISGLLAIANEDAPPLE